MQEVLQCRYLNQYRCLADKCPDHCCGGWVIGVTEANVENIKENAPELLDFIDKKVENNDISYSMKRNEEKTCVMMQDGLCKIHAKYGEKMLPDICSYFPHRYKKIGDTVFCTADLSCHATCKLALFTPNGFRLTTAFKSHVANDMSDYSYRLKDFSTQDVLSLYNTCIDIVENSSDADQAMLKLISICTELHQVNAHALSTETLKFAADNFTKYQIFKKHEAPTTILKVLHTVKQNTVNKRPRYDSIIGEFKYNNCLFIADNLLDAHKWQKVISSWYNYNDFKKIDTILKNLILSSLSVSFFPLCTTYESERILEIAHLCISYLATKMIIMSEIHEKGKIENDKIIDIAQAIEKLLRGKDKERIYSMCNENGLKDMQDFLDAMSSCATF